MAYSTRQEATLLGTLKLNAPLPHLLGVVWGVSVPQVNGQNVVKVGHRQVVNMIRQGGNTLMVKVVMVTRHPDMDEAVHKKGAPPPRVRPGLALHCHQTKTLRNPRWRVFPSSRLLVHDPYGEKLRQGGFSMLVVAVL